jgi:hypothetical protein
VNNEPAQCYTITKPSYRRQGLGEQVTAAHDLAVLQNGKIAFSSYAQDNMASLRLAKAWHWSGSLDWPHMSETMTNNIWQGEGVRLRAVEPDDWRHVFTRNEDTL